MPLDHVRIFGWFPKAYFIFEGVASIEKLEKNAPKTLNQTLPRAWPSLEGCAASRYRESKNEMKNNDILTSRLVNVFLDFVSIMVW